MIDRFNFQNGVHLLLKTKRYSSQCKKKGQESKGRCSWKLEQIIDRSVLVFNENVCT